MTENNNKIGSEKDNVKTESFRRVFLSWTVIAFVLGGVGSYLGNLVFSAPFYFGFFFVFTLVGLAGLFALAVLVDKQQNQGR